MRMINKRRKRDEKSEKEMSKATEFLKSKARTQLGCPNCNCVDYKNDKENPSIIFICDACETHFEDDDADVKLTDAQQALRIQEMETAEKIFAEIEKESFIQFPFLNPKSRYLEFKSHFLGGQGNNTSVPKDSGIPPQSKKKAKEVSQ